MCPPDGVGRCRCCPLQAPLYDGLCIACWSLCAHCGGSGRVVILYPQRRTGWPSAVERGCQACRGSGRARWAA